MAIYVHRNDQKLGPYTVAEVRSQLASGALSLKDHVWWTGQDGWVPLVGSEVLKPGFEDPDPTMRKKDGGLTGISSFSVAAIIAGCLFPFSLFTSVPAIVFGHCALDEIKKNPGRKGRNMAIIGLILGYMVTLASLVLLGCYIYFYEQVQAVKTREEVVNSDVFVPAVPGRNAPANAAPSPAPSITPVPSATPVPAVTPVPSVAPAPPSTSAPPTTNLDQPIAPATANPGQ